MRILAVELTTLDHTRRLARGLAQVLEPGMALLFDGPMGIGKTTLTCALAEELGYDEARSPTFALVNRYDTRSFPLLHVDLYRLDEADGREFGFEEVLEDGAVMIVEWPDRLRHFDPAQVWTVRFSADPRRCEIQASGDRAEELLDRMNEVLNGSAAGS